MSLGNTESNVPLGINESDVRLDNSDSTTENTSGEYTRRITSKNSSKSPFKESSFQEAAGAQNRAAPPPQINKSSHSKTGGQDHGTITTEAAFQDFLSEGEDPTTSPPRQPSVDPKMLTEVRRVMENGRHAPVALKHYRAGNISVEDVAEYVSQDATHSPDAAQTLLPAVRLILEEDSSGAAS